MNGFLVLNKSHSFLSEILPYIEKSDALEVSVFLIRQWSKVTKFCVYLNIIKSHALLHSSDFKADIHAYKHTLCSVIPCFCTSLTSIENHVLYILTILREKPY